jgi:PilZ domain
MMLAYTKAPMLVGDMVDLRYSPASGRAIGARGVVVGSSETVFLVRIIDGERVVREKPNGALVVSRETALGADMFATVISQMVDRDAEALVVCPVPKHLDRFERRRHVRVPIAVPLVVTSYRAGSASTTIETTTIDLSLGGTQFEATHSFTVDELIGLEMTLAAEPASATATVVKVDAPQIGGDRSYRVHCRFVRIDAEVANRIALVIEQSGRHPRPAERSDRRA